MIKTKNNVFRNKSLLGNIWKVHTFDEKLILASSQKNKISPLLSKLLSFRGIDSDHVFDFLYSDLKNNIPNPFLLKDMDKSVNRVIESIKKNEKIGIIADYDVDGSTSASILFKFLSYFKTNIVIKTPNRLSEGYGPNLRLMDEMQHEKVNLIFTLDCGTSAHNIIDHIKYKNINVIVIDHHLGELTLPQVFSIINPNRYDEKNNFKQLAAVGVTFLFLMSLRKKLREQDFFKKSIKEPNLKNLLDLVALGTVCDVVKLVGYNRFFVKLGLQLIKERKNKGISQIIDNSNLRSTPNSGDLGFIIGPQLNAASRIDDSSLPTKLLISNDTNEIEKITKKLSLLNEKRKLIEINVFENALLQAERQKNKKFILVHGKHWHNGILGIVASRIISIYHKPTIVISFTNSLGVGSARSIDNVDLGGIILNAKNKKILIGGGGHKMAAGLQINFNLLDDFIIFLNKTFDKFPIKIFQKIDFFDLEISSNQINNNLLDSIDKLEPFGSGNPEPKFIINDLKIDSIKILKDKHLLIIFQNDFSINFKGICFNCIGTALGDYLLNFKQYKFFIACTVRKDTFATSLQPQIIIKDAMIIN